MQDIRDKLATLYDLQILQDQALAIDEKLDSDSEEETVDQRIDFNLPYHEYMHIIETHGRVDAESTADAQSTALDPASSPVASTRTESVMPESDSEQPSQPAPTKRGRKARNASPKASKKDTESKKARATGSRKSSRKK